MTRLRGFSPQFDSIQQFILTLTHVVWEQKDIGQLADFTPRRWFSLPPKNSCMSFPSLCA